MVDYTGTAGNDTFVGGSDDDSANGQGGDDKLSGGDGNDTLIGGDGHDRLDGGAGDDFLFSGEFANRYHNYDSRAEVDTLIGGDGSDTIYAGYGDNIDGGANSSRSEDYVALNLMGAPSGLTLDLPDTQASMTIGGGTIVNEQILLELDGTQYNDHITIGYVQTLDGEDGSDVLVLTAFASDVLGGAGNDVIDGRGDKVDIGSLVGEAGDDTLYGNALTLSASGGTGADTIYSGGAVGGDSGNDWIFVQPDGYIADVVNGGGGADKIIAASTKAFMIGGTGSDTLMGGAGNDTLASGRLEINGDVRPDHGRVQDHLSGGAGDDVLYVGYGDSADGGTGNDTLSLSFIGAKAGVHFATADILSGHMDSLNGGMISSIEAVGRITGTSFDDVLHVAAQVAPVTLDAGDGNDLIIVDGANYTIGGVAARGTFDGGAGHNTLDLRDDASGAQVDLGTAKYGGTFDGSSLYHFQDVAGSAYSDTLLGSDAADVLDGRAGDDVLNGETGNDTLLGGIGSDNIVGNVGNDTISGGSGSDTISGSDGNDTVSGESGSDTIAGGAGNDTISGGSGSDHLDTGTGNNSISGGSGNDVITIGDGVDTLSGGSGHDRFVFGDDLIGTTADKEDRITDFSSGDKIDLSQIDARSWVFIGEDAFTPDSIPQVRYYESGGNTYIEGDLGGYGIKDFIIRLDGLHDLTSTDFAFGNP